MAINRPPTLSVGTRVSERYEILAVVGQGGLGTVYQVRDSSGQVFALKETFDLSEGAREQFEREARWLARLDHPNIPKVRSFFEWQHRLYLIMDFISGENLEQKLVKSNFQALAERDVLRWIMPICDALSYMHTRHPPLVHRDVKPANIIVTANGHTALVDLGIAKEHIPGLPNITATFIRKAGTEGYAPPEQYTSNGKTGPWSDIYSMGATLYHLLTGHVPASAIERAALDGQLIAPRALNHALSVGAEAIIMSAIAIRPQDRFASMHEMWLAINTVLTQPPMKRPSVPIIATRPVIVSSGPQHISSPVYPASAAPPSRTASPSQPGRQNPPSQVLLPGMPVPPPPVSAEPLSLPLHQRRGAGAIDRSRGASIMPIPSAPSVNGAPVAPPSAAPINEPLPVPNSRPRTGAGQAASPRAQRVRFPWQIIAFTSLIIAVGFGILIGTQVITVGANNINRSTPDAAIKGYYNALKGHDYVGAYAYLSNRAANTTSQQQFIQQEQDDIAHQGDITGITINSELRNGDMIVASIVIIRHGGVQTNATVTLISSNGGWYIDSVT